MQLIQLTNAETSHRKPIYVNMQHVIMAVPQPDNTTMLYLDAKLNNYPAYQIVVEPIEKIMELIEGNW
jgi:hypothetical protein